MMKIVFKISTVSVICIALLSLAAAAQTGTVGIGTVTPDSTAQLDVASTTKGLLIPRMTAAQRVAIQSPATGLQVYQTDGTAGILFFDGVRWIHQAYGVPVSNAGNIDLDIRVSTLAGSGTFGFIDGTGAAAQFKYPSGVAVDGAGNVYVADQNSHRIRKVTPTGVVSTLAGSGTAGPADGTGAAAQFNSPTGVALDGVGNVYVADQLNHRIRKVTPVGVVTTLAGNGSSGSADGTGAAAHFYSPYGVAVDGSGNVYVAEFNNHRIRRVTPAGVVTTLAGSSQGFADGTGAAAQFNFPAGVAVDGAGNVYVADQVNHRIRKVSVPLYATAASLSDYATTASLSNYATTASLSSYATTASLSGYVNTAGAQTIGGVKTFSANVVANGNVGIGTSSPNAPLQLANTLANRKVVLYETANNDHQFLGFGINIGMLRYQVANAGDDHVFFRGDNATTSTELMRIKGTGNVGIGVPVPAQKLDVAGTVQATSFLGSGTGLSGVALLSGAQTIGGSKTFSSPLTLDGGGSDAFVIRGGGDVRIWNDANTANIALYAAGGSTGNGISTLVLQSDGKTFTFNGTGGSVSSDRRLKQDITPLEHSLEKVLRLNGYTYRFKTKADVAQKEVGVIAQEVQAVLPEAVSENADGTLAVSYSSLVPLLINAIKEQQARIAELEVKEAAYAELAAQVKEMQQMLGVKPRKGGAKVGRR